MSKIRLNKFLAQSGAVSRRKADELIKQGHVTINKKPTTSADLGTKIDPSTDKITLKGKTIQPQKDFIYLTINKPRGYTTTLKDKHADKTIADLIPKNLKDKGLKPAGRLDKDSEGLVVLTNDLEMINRLTHPKYGTEKEYKVQIEGKLTPKHKEQLEKGVRIPESDDKTEYKTRPCKIHVVDTKRTTEKTTNLKIILKEGRNRQIRKMFKLLGYRVLYLQRIRIGKLKLTDKECLQA